MPRAARCRRCLSDIGGFFVGAAPVGSGVRQRLAIPISEAIADVDETSGDPHTLWEALGHDPTPMDALVIRTGLTVAQLSPMLLALELQGRLSVEHGRYARKSA